MTENGADGSDGLGGVVLSSRGGARIQENHIAGSCGIFQGIHDSIEFILHDGIDLRNSAPLRKHGGKDGTVEFDDVARTRVFGGGYDLIPGRNDADDRPGQDFYLQNAGSQKSADGGGGDSGVSRQDHFPGADILADLADMLPGSSGGGVRCVYGDAVHGGSGIVGSADMGIDCLCGDASGRLLYGDFLRGGMEAAGAQHCQIFGCGLGKLCISQVLKSHNNLRSVFK